jgi:hypothetical protein
MAEPEEYKSTMFDRYGPEAMQRMVAIGSMVFVFCVVFLLVSALRGFHWWVPVVAVAAAVIGGGAGSWIGASIIGGYNLMTANGSSTRRW